MNKKSHWFLDWFNQDYLNLYAHRDKAEAEAHIRFLCNHLNLKGDERILDLGCGSGRHSILLGKLGFHVTGVDTSEFLIGEAVKNSQGTSTVKFLCRDMREIEDLGDFDLILSMFTSFGYFESDAQNQEVLDIVAESLASSGKFFMDYLNVPHIYSNLKPHDQFVVNGEEVLVTREIIRDQVIKTIEFPGRSYHESVKLYEPEIISEMLEKSGLSIVKQWGSYEGEPLSPSSERLLTLSI